MTDIYPHLYRHQFVSALAVHGPTQLPQRRFLIVLTALADQWSLVDPDGEHLASLFRVNHKTVEDWLAEFHQEGWLSDVPGTGLALIHLPQGSPAYQAALPSFEWHTRDHVPIGPFLRTPAGTTRCQAPSREGPIPLTARALQLAAGSAGKTKKGQFAYLAFVQQSLMPQPQRTEHTEHWDKYLDGY